MIIERKIKIGKGELELKEIKGKERGKERGKEKENERGGEKRWHGGKRKKETR